jgi:hypothetical protein
MTSRLLVVVAAAAAAVLVPAAADDFLSLSVDPIPTLPNTPFTLNFTGFVDSATAPGPGCSATRLTLTNTVLTGQTPSPANLGCTPTTVAGSGTAPECAYALFTCTGAYN